MYSFSKQEPKASVLNIAAIGDSMKPPDIATIIKDSVVTEAEFLTIEMPQRPYYMKPWLRPGTLAMVFAQRGLGKTFFCLSLGLAISRGIPFGSWQSEVPAGCLYVDGELAAEELQERVSKLSTGLPQPRATFKVLSWDQMRRKGHPSLTLKDEKWRQGFTEYLKISSEIGVVILDNLASLTSGLEENDKKEWDPINQWLLSLRSMGISVIMVHHAGKGGDQRGTSAREDNIDVTIRLARSGGYCAEDGAEFTVEFTKARGLCGDGASPFRMRLVDSAAGGLELITIDKQGGKKDQIIALLGKGTCQNQIPAISECSKQYVSRIKNEAIKAGYLDKSGKFTTEGKTRYGDLVINDQ